MQVIKKALLIFILYFSTSALAAGSEKFFWEEVIEAIIKVESECQTSAKRSNYAGPMQISPIMVKECNAILKERQSSKRYTLADRYSLSKSKEMFILFQEKHNPDRNVEWAVRAWNGGPYFSKKATDAYYKKVIEALRD